MATRHAGRITRTTIITASPSTLTSRAHGIEWEDDMVEVNRRTTPANMRWKLVDRETGAENAQIDWTSGSATRSSCGS